MRQPRQHQFDPANPPWLHCISRCVRRAFLCGDGLEHRKSWLEKRLEILSHCFAVEVGAYAIMSNHLHAVLRPRPEKVLQLTDHEVARRWWFIRHNMHPHNQSQQPQPAVIEALIKDHEFIARWRPRLGSLSWFMKAVKEPLSRMANREDGCSGAFWEGRFTSVPLLNASAIVACMAYVDLNPIRAKIAQVPEKSEYTSIKSRIAKRKAKGNRLGKPSNPDWLASIETLTSSQPGDPGLSLNAYLRLVDLTGRCVRSDKKGAIPAELSEILQRLDGQLDPAAWLKTIGRAGSLRGSALGSLADLASEATRRGCRWLQSRCALFRRGRLAGTGS